MSRRPKAGLLPLYLQLYDKTMPHLREEFQRFLKTVMVGLTEEGIDVVLGETCRLEPEFLDAVTRFEREEVDTIVTLHLAYSLSLESIGVLSKTALPLLLLDTTMDDDFGQQVHPDRLMFNHGIHGVQDLACMLRRRGKPFEIVAGHVRESNILSRAADCVRAASAVRLLRTTRALRIGGCFQGMGDFSVEHDVLSGTLGITVEDIQPEALCEDVGAVSSGEVEEEIRRDCACYEIEVSNETHQNSVRLGLGLRRYLERGRFSALSMNFLAFNACDGPIQTVPFLEISKAMARGIGYAGEGDVLTAALVGALQSAFGRTTFTEVFCPDWKGGSLFLSHMGEINPEIAADKARLCEKEFPWTGAKNPAVLACAPAPGPAVLVNLAPGPGDRFHLILAPVEVLADSAGPEWRDSIRGWIRPDKGIEAFLEEYSRIGGTHHSALLLGDRQEALAAFASYARLPFTVL